jgi:hypothetical protein
MPEPTVAILDGSIFAVSDRDLWMPARDCVAVALDGLGLALRRERLAARPE